MRIVHIVIAIVLLVSLCFGCYFFLKQKQQEQVYIAYREKAQNVFADNQALRETIDAMIAHEDKFIDLQKIISENQYNLMRLKDDEPYLMIRLSQNYCHPCMSVLMNRLQKYTDLKNAIFLISYKDERFQKDFKVYRSPYPFIRVDSLPIPADKLEKPYLFVWEKKHKTISHFFIPIVGNMNQIDDYLLKISSIVP